MQFASDTNDSRAPVCVGSFPDFLKHFNESSRSSTTRGKKTLLGGENFKSLLVNVKGSQCSRCGSMPRGNPFQTVLFEVYLLARVWKFNIPGLHDIRVYWVRDHVL